MILTTTIQISWQLYDDYLNINYHKIYFYLSFFMLTFVDKI